MRFQKIPNPAFAKNFSCLSQWKVRNPDPRYKLGTSWTSPFGRNVLRNSRRIMWSSSFFRHKVLKKDEIRVLQEFWSEFWSEKQLTLQLLNVFFCGVCKMQMISCINGFANLYNTFQSYDLIISFTDILTLLIFPLHQLKPNSKTQ